MGNHTASAGGGTYAARAQTRSAARASHAAATPVHPQALPAVHAPAPTPHSTSTPAQPAQAQARRTPVASSAALSFHRANRPAGSTLRTIGPGLYLLKMPGVAARTITGQELNQAFRDAARLNRQGARTQARQVHDAIHPRHEAGNAHAGSRGGGKHGGGTIAHEALAHYHRTLGLLGRLMHS